jgi:hypothetical protein
MAKTGRCIAGRKFIKDGNIQLSKENWAEKMQKVIMPLQRNIM